ncbi:MAG: hypothetical protein O2820_26600 [Planctomycetota bacterium]|nr:hypothetical protein [Planctomycetota bacterium]MDA1252777.1 hypothetical protein [Planctomycetota bacterium]
MAVHLVLLGVLGLIVFQISAGENRSAVEGSISTGTSEADLMNLEEVPMEVVTITPTPNRLDLSRITREQNDPTVARRTLREPVRQLSRMSPLKENLYANYYISQVKKHDVSGGRLYSTCISILILEIYYRHLPLYGSDATLLSIPENEASE